MENKEKVAVFKSYLRRLMRDLIDLKKAIKEKNLGRENMKDEEE